MRISLLKLVFISVLIFSLAVSKASSNITYTPNGTSGLNLVYNGGVDDYFFTVNLPWTVSFLGSNYGTVYVGTNGYITFASGNSTYYSFSPANPGGPHISIYPGDRILTKLYYAQLNAGTADAKFVIRVEGYDYSNAGITHIYEVHFYSGQSYYDIYFVDAPSSGNQNGGTTAISNGSAYVLNLTPTESTGLRIASSGSLYASQVSITITTNQQTRKSTAQGTTGSGVYIDQVGDNLTLNVEQHGTGNFIRGKNWSGSGIIDGDDNTVNLQQGSTTKSSDNNGIGLGIVGDSNTVTMRQDSLGFGSGGHRALLDLTGNTNSVIMMQDNTGSGGHYQDVVVVGNSNDLTLQQQNNVAKDLFTTITGSSNTVSVMQKDSGQHYLDVILGGNGHSVGVTQQGTGNHAARIELNNGGGSSTVSLTQQGSTSQNYNLTQTCTNANGCSTSLTQQ
jgi:hypothetical protein